MTPEEAIRQHVDSSYEDWRLGGAVPRRNRSGTESYRAPDVAALLRPVLEAINLRTYATSGGKELFVTSGGRHVRHAKLADIILGALEGHEDAPLVAALARPDSRYRVFRELAASLPPLPLDVPFVTDAVPPAPAPVDLTVSSEDAARIDDWLDQDGSLDGGETTAELYERYAWEMRDLGLPRVSVRRFRAYLLTLPTLAQVRRADRRVWVRRAQ